MTDSPRKQIHLAAHFPGVNNTTVWTDPASGSQIDFASFRHLAQTAERGRFDFLFLAEGLRLREHAGRIYDLDVVGRPDNLTMLAAVAGVTEHLGLAATVNSTYHEPYELARQLATLDHLSDGRAAWNIVTSWDAFTGENFRRGGYLPHDERYLRAKNFLEAAVTLWQSWTDAGCEPGRFQIQNRHFDISGQFNVPPSPQGRPVIIQAGQSDEGREFAASSADIIFSRHAKFDDGRAFYHDVKSRLVKYGRAWSDLLILPSASVVLGDDDHEAREIYREVRLAQVSPATAVAFLEQLWNTDLSGHDPDGPLPTIDPVDTDLEGLITQGRSSVRSLIQDRAATARQWRELAETRQLSTRELVIAVTERQCFVGSAATVADELDRFVQQDAADGFVLVPHLTPTGLDRFVDEVVPLLQERGSHRTEYRGATLRENLGLPTPPGTWSGSSALVPDSRSADTAADR
ncbi:NtaA/DmoA family FMN-dependent monooxygenase [Nakamurella leprariae]|uniref:NtaA/DmoA family FMN-dependent monooxygenase n=1 Tax=Nakamurella leprariae TaxID=2803911 RepID=A0A938YBX4_9ACTN|nr:NtaA/DmoA family FMN-dependent monooxygenase [Nakamurella leprariae]MBM9465667.1 NtaA/DmoA family FMN-dependent monooxygenase [Nakamurella leprariae]